MVKSLDRMVDGAANSIYYTAKAAATLVGTKAGHMAMSTGFGAYMGHKIGEYEIQGFDVASKLYDKVCGHVATVTNNGAATDHRDIIAGAAIGGIAYLVALAYTKRNVKK